MSSFPRIPSELTVGHAAGIIAACMVVIQLLCPAVLTYVLAGLLRDTETASTWTVASANLLSSIWPAILRTDSAGNGGRVRTMIMVVAKCIPLLAVLGAITGVVTPLGLGEEPTVLRPTTADFQYLRDDSAYYLGTSPRGQHSLSRVCSGDHNGFARAAACPYSNSQVVIDDEDPDFLPVATFPTPYNFTIPDAAREIFSSGARGTVSSVFDIEWRQLTRRVSDFGDVEIDVGTFLPMETIVLGNGYQVVEGLVVDTQAGGIGFRNHSVPVGLGRGATWDEDILFVEPTTACVSTNLTLDFEVLAQGNGTGGPDVGNLVLVDHGGFAQLNTTLPDHTAYGNAQIDPNLDQRAYIAAWYNNALTMLYLNVSNPKNEPVNGTKSFAYINSALGQKHALSASNSDGYKGMKLSPEFGNYLLLNSSANSTSSRNTGFANPFDITQKDFDTINNICSRLGPFSMANMTNAYVACSLLRGAPRRSDGSDSLLFESGSKWSSPLYSCASSVRATVKTVTFVMNGTSIHELIASRIEPKAYSREEDMPLWGLEDWGFRLDGYKPIWGMLSPEYATREKVATIRKAHFYLPGYSTGGGYVPKLSVGSPEVDNLAGTSFAQHAMSTVIETVANPIGLDDWPFDLRGRANIAVLQRWQQLSRDSASAATIINRLWTDVAASAVVGTRGVHTPKDAANAQPQEQILVRPAGTRITYDLRFGIPAAFLLVWLAVILLTALCCTCCCGGRAGFKSLRRRIEQLSAGRIFTTFLFPEESTLTMPARHWREANGMKKVTVNVVARREGEEEYIYTRNDSSPGGETYGLIPGPKR